MKSGFYPRIAIRGMRLNRKFYMPYILAAIGMVCMNYIINYLAHTPTMDYMRGGSDVKILLNIGVMVTAIFSALFLFYTNSFLMRRRKKELGMYNILGMNKRNIGVVLLWETLLTAIISIGGGIAAGIVLSKLSELALIKFIKGSINYSYYISGGTIWRTAALFAIIFALIYLKAVREIHTGNPVDLLNSEKAGEKPPKANFFLGLAGIVILGAAYYIAVTIKQPLQALVWFFIAVIMVIVATYLIFIAASVALCRLLQKKKNYYYKANHFISVSSMAYRMKRNGAGLASICILSTMVLVMITGSACLYFGSEDVMRSRYPDDVGVTLNLKNVEGLSDSNRQVLVKATQSTVEEVGINAVLENRMNASVPGYMDDNRLKVQADGDDGEQPGTYGDLRTVYFMSESDYENMTGKSCSLGKNQAIIYTYRCGYDYSDFIIENGKRLEVVEKADDLKWTGNMALNIAPTIVVVVADVEETIEPIMKVKYDTGYCVMSLHWYCGINSDEGADKQIELNEALKQTFKSMEQEEKGYISSYMCESLENNRDSFYATFGGLFFLGILLSIIFIFAAALIIYYKQVSEGYEDRERFEIMKKVGMTDRNIKRSINSQVLTVFFMPLVFAVIHLVFAFPLIQKLLHLFSLFNTWLMIGVAGICVVLFAVFYIAVYKLTSNAYYKIVVFK